jgi:hypothetical protein
MAVDVIAVLTWLGFAAWTIQVGVRKHRVLPAVVLGVGFAWLGLIVMYLVPARRIE